MTKKRTAKPYQELEFTDGFMFKKVLTTRTDYCKELLELILKKKIHRLKIMDYEKTFDEYYESRGVRMDVYTEDDENTVYDIEMQASDEPNIAKRSRYYHSSMDSYQLEHGDGYESLKKSIVIFICKKKINDAFTKPVYTFTYRAEEEPEMKLGDETVTVLVNGQCEDRSIDDEMKDLISLIRSGHTEGKEDSLAARIENLVNEAKRDGRWSAEYMRYKQAERDIARKYIKDEKARADSEKARAESAEARAESAEARAESAEARAESVEARLKEKERQIEELKSQIMKHP